MMTAIERENWPAGTEIRKGNVGKEILIDILSSSREDMLHPCVDTRHGAALFGRYLRKVAPGKL
jgi:hypothetical protein